MAATDRQVFDPHSAEFWAQFAATYWERQPALLTVPESFFTLDQVFTAITHLPAHTPSDRLWLAVADPPRTMRDFRQIDLALMGPQPADGDFDAFFNRLASHRFGINVHRLAAGNPALHAHRRVFAEHLTDVPNSPTPEGWWLDAFVGTYRATPFGIHRDPAGVFAFPLMGQRTYYTWPADYFEPGHVDLQRPDPDVISRHLPAAEPHEVGPGDCFYWPSDRWHLVVSDGNPFVVAQVFATFARADVGQ